MANRIISNRQTVKAMDSVARVLNERMKMEVRRIAPYTAAFWPKKQNGQYYSIDLVLDDPDSYETPAVKPKEETDNISIDDLMEVTT